MTKVERAALVIIIGMYALIVGLLASGYAFGLTDMGDRWMQAFAVLGMLLTILLGAAGAVGLIILAIAWVSRGKTP